MTVIDVSAFVGAYPFRDLGSAGSANWLVEQMNRLHIDQAWVGYLPAVFHRDPAPGNHALELITASCAGRLLPVPTVNPEQPRWQDDLNRALEHGAPAVRVFPQYQGIDPAGDEMRVLLAATAIATIPLILTVRLEDARQRHPLDVAPELPAAAVRALVRSDAQARVLVTHADAAYVQEVHFGLTDREAGQVLWDITWLWGPPEDHLGRLIHTIGHERFTLGTGMPLRIGDVAMARLDLLDLPDETRRALLGGNLQDWIGRVSETESSVDPAG
jgi:hypothetical protein